MKKAHALALLSGAENADAASTDEQAMRASLELNEAKEQNGRKVSAGATMLRL
jgi:hypothetical protein